MKIFLTETFQHRDEDGNVISQSDYAKEIKQRLAHAQSQPYGSDPQAACPNHVDRIKNIGTASGFVDKPGNRIELTGKAEKAGDRLFHCFIIHSSIEVPVLVTGTVRTKNKCI